MKLGNLLIVSLNSVVIEVAVIPAPNPTSGPDRSFWCLSSNGSFSVGSTYELIIHGKWSKERLVRKLIW